jgi:hypothetical protein
MCGASIIVAVSLRFLLARENSKLDEADEQVVVGESEDDQRPVGFRYIL